jgi:glycosyltransferase involved in cell wall biosynthesis
MRILYTHNINHIAETYAKEVAQRGHMAVVYEPDLRGAAACWPLKFSLLPLRALDMVHALRKFHEQHFDLIHIHWASYGVFGSVSKIPMVVHCHGSDVRTRLTHPLFRPVLRAILCQAVEVLCVTPDLLPIVRSVRPDAHFAPAPIDIALFAPKEMSVENASSPWTILLFARLDPEKGSAIALEGIERFVQRHAGVRVLLLDWGPLKEEYKRHYGKQFEFVPLVPPDQVPQLILSANVIVGQFALGSLGLAELQAMSCAKPVICSFRYAEAYPAPAPLCQATTAEEVDGHLEHLFQHPEAGEMLGRNAREWIRFYHSTGILTDTLEALYHSILQRTRVST